MMKKVYLKKGKEDSLNRFHPWVFSGAIARMDDGTEEGDTVEVVGDGLKVRGHYQIGSIAVRVLTFENEDIDALFWQKKLDSALQMRLRLGIADNPDNNTYRLVHGEGDFLPGLVIDVYDETAVMQAHSVGMHISRNDIAEALMKVMNGRIKNVFYKSETTLPYKFIEHTSNENENPSHRQAQGKLGSGQAQNENETLNPQPSTLDLQPSTFNLQPSFSSWLIGGSPSSSSREPGRNIAVENGLRFYVDWLRGQKTGFFVDQRENRLLLERYAKGKNVLNMFCYTGGFSFYAMRGGANLVHSVDSSEKAIELTCRNVELNFPNDKRHKAYCEDAFKFLDGIGMQKDAEGNPLQYDLIILDPPAFAKHRAALKNALKGYTRLNQKALQKIKSGGILFTFSCSQVVTKDNFRNAVFTAAALAKRKVRILHQLHQPADHAINIFHPEGEYLKGLVLYVE